MSPHLSQEIRQRMVVWSKDFGKSNKEIAELATCCKCTVREVLRLDREYGIVYNPLVQLPNNHGKMAHS